MYFCHVYFNFLNYTDVVFPLMYPLSVQNLKQCYIPLLVYSLVDLMNVSQELLET